MPDDYAGTIGHCGFVAGVKSGPCAGIAPSGLAFEAAAQSIRRKWLRSIRGDNPVPGHERLFTAARRGISAGGPDGLSSFYPTTPMYYDLLTIQALYGRNMSHNAGDTTYKFVDGRSYFQTIDDAAGHDRIIYAGALASTIDLREARFSTLSAPIVFSDMTSTRASVAIGPNSVIEDAYGGTSGDRIIGNGADNHLYGRGGNDVLTGGAGHDAFFFNASLSATTNLDRVTDFHHGIDSFELAHGYFSHIARGALSSAAFFTGTAAHDSNDHIIYDKAHGALYYDADGTGQSAAVEFATVKAGLGLSAADFIIY